jgi:hypothetical protein
MEYIENKLPCSHQIGDSIVVITCDCGQDDCEGTIIHGTVVAIKFTVAKVFYDILDDYTSDVVKNVISDLVIHIEDEQNDLNDD